ncbi:hypothetical protein G6K88_34410 [Agrobacterium rhizogenes]|uniref:ClpXP protease specificity-enhancing factor SspB n=1 Tax=Rhizobium rhizogenes TaxID=359 RepID=UPI00115EC2BA|nr:ClpXP protease specificity-enhancing factor SspB [Rhizobium rhizogenes]NTG39383.1 hypothetical protein [Rhizobium rhizogenes]NTG58634.1 hypothetical protein [Rhizobium rhizogenes]NTI07109.1 hypothetical protein [Rhizobium rhizogenes]NTI13923.1 hypothetical protein [Rhizobium rhizogenes]TRB15344.1 hypothetical protein EXN70_33940 [Rhizobium rhizogenes]
MSQRNFLRYDIRVTAALRSVIRDVLSEIELIGLPAGHFFQISFLTNTGNSSLPRYIHERHGDRLHIVIKDNFKDLQVFERHAMVKLVFDGKYEQVSINFDDIVYFGDPSVDFSLAFEEAEESADNDEPSALAMDVPLVQMSEPGTGPLLPGNVVKLSEQRNRLRSQRPLTPRHDT